MRSNARPFSFEKVKALRAYFHRLMGSARGTPEHHDLETVVTLCEQLIAVMTDNEQLRQAAAKSAPDVRAFERAGEHDAATDARKSA